MLRSRIVLKGMEWYGWHRGGVMTKGKPKAVSLSTIHGDLKSGFTDLKGTLIRGFQSLPTRESSEEMVRLLRENNRRLKTALVSAEGGEA